MKEIFIATGTVTQALRAKEILEANGYHTNLKKWNDESGKYGCGHGVSLRTNSIQTVKDLLGENGIRIIDVIVHQR